jgi:hypothetical protein
MFSVIIYLRTSNLTFLSVATRYTVVALQEMERRREGNEERKERDICSPPLFRPEIRP